MKNDATIFVVDDDPSLLKATTRALIIANWKVEPFLSAKSFLERPHYSGLGCMLIDLRMPEMSGLELQTVKIHRGRVMAKMEVESVPDLLRIMARIRVS